MNREQYEGAKEKMRTIMALAVKMAYGMQIPTELVFAEFDLAARLHRIGLRDVAEKRGKLAEMDERIEAIERANQEVAEAEGRNYKDLTELEDDT
jgi:hypothetical protein